MLDENRILQMCTEVCVGRSRLLLLHKTNLCLKILPLGFVAHLPVHDHYPYSQWTCSDLKK